jgi:hypothetical protein
MSGVVFVPAGCTGPGPAAPTNATSYNCPSTASGGNCSTSCLPGYSLVPGSSLQITCRLGNWSTPTGTCINFGSGELRALQGKISANHLQEKHMQGHYWQEG